MDTFEKLLLDINISHKNHNEKRTKLYTRYYSNFPIHPKLFIENINKDDLPCMCEIDTNVVQKALDNGEVKKLEVYVLWAWLRSGNICESNYENYEDEEYCEDKGGDQYNVRLVQKCYDEVIRPAFEKHYPEKEIQTSNIKVKLDMKMKEAKFDVVYGNVYGGLNHDHLSNKYKHKNDMKKKFLYGEIQPNNQGKIDYQLALFTRLFEVEMILMLK